MYFVWCLYSCCCCHCCFCNCSVCFVVVLHPLTDMPNNQLISTGFNWHHGVIHCHTGCSSPTRSMKRNYDDPQCHWTPPRTPPWTSLDTSIRLLCTRLGRTSKCSLHKFNDHLVYMTGRHWQAVNQKRGYSVLKTGMYNCDLFIFLFMFMLTSEQPIWHVPVNIKTIVQWSVYKSYNPSLKSKPTAPTLLHQKWPKVTPNDCMSVCV